MVRLKKDGTPKASGGFRKEALEANLNYPNLGAGPLVRIPESRLDEVKRFLDLLNQYPDRCPVLFFDGRVVVPVLRQERVIEILEQALYLRANAGGAIKTRIRSALEVLNS